MDWRQEAAERLKKLDGLRQAEFSLEQELERLKQEQAGVQSSLTQVRSQLTALEGAMQVLTPEERLVAERLFVYPQKGNVQWLCQILHMERTTVYRWRNRVLRKLAQAMFL